MNTFGHLFRVTTFGESHGPAIGCVVDGCPPRIPLTVEDIQADLDRRRPGQSRFTTQRREPDAVEILSGVFEGMTTGTPIALLIRNVDQRSKDYDPTAVRPGHADATYQAKYGIRDYRGGGRSSARETAARVAAGAIARKVIAPMIVRAALVQIGDYHVGAGAFDWTETRQNPFFAPDATIVPVWSEYLDSVRKSGSSVGAMLHVEATDVPAGLGAPIYGKLDADIAAAMMGINAVKGVEIGAGMAVAGMRGESNADPAMAGGILGGISDGSPVVVRLAVKPTPSILNSPVPTRGRHDPCVGIRAVPIAEAMLACVLADHMMRHRALRNR